MINEKMFWQSVWCQSSCTEMALGTRGIFIHLHRWSRKLGVYHQSPLLIIGWGLVIALSGYLLVALLIGLEAEKRSRVQTSQKLSAFRSSCHQGHRFVALRAKSYGLGRSFPPWRLAISLTWSQSQVCLSVKKVFQNILSWYLQQKSISLATCL